jgi:DNA invertase Pin-like site-specific DNA recombinase
MTIYGYARVSTDLQDVDLQVDALAKAGCEKIVRERFSAADVVSREELTTLLKFLRHGDVLTVTRLDRLARNIRDLQNLVHDLSELGVSLKAIEQPVDTSTAAGKAFFDMLGVFAEFERNLLRERQRAGIEKAKAAGKYKGRKPISRAMIEELAATGLTKAKIAKKLGCNRITVYRVLARD